jgi:RimJ/RimL family protein N-acetyltransferase
MLPESGPMNAGVETERLFLRLATLDDVDLLLEINDDPEVMRYLTGGPPQPRVDVEAVIGNNPSSRWIAFERATGELVGWFGLKPVPEPSERELGYRMRRVMWGKGYATEAARALLAVGFGDLGLARVWAKAMTVNERSRAVMERLGMRYVRTFFADYPEFVEGDQYGEVEYEILASEWQ